MKIIKNQLKSARAAAALLTFLTLLCPAGAQLISQFGILNLEANGGINPNTGVAWKEGDKYRLAFYTANTFKADNTDITYYNTLVTAEAVLNPALVGSTWTALISTVAVNVKDNTGTADLTGGAGIGGAGFPIYAMDGKTCIARNNADIWNSWSNPFDSDSSVRLVSGSTNLNSAGVPVTASQSVYYSPFLDQYGLGDSATVHGATVWTGTRPGGGTHPTQPVGASIGSPVGATVPNTQWGSSNANNTSRMWERGNSNNVTTSLSFYAISDPLTVMAAGGDPYVNWAGGFPGLTDANPELDFDLGGLETGVEWVVGGDPTNPGDDAGLTPTSVTGETYLVFTYKRSDAANTDTNTAIKTEYGTDLEGWTAAQDGVAGVIISVLEGSPSDTVEVKIPRSLAAPGSKLFARLKVTVTIP